jgi:hypothetical protein
MTEQGLKLQERFVDFVNSPEYGGPTDFFSYKKLSDIKKKSEDSNKTGKLRLIEEELKKCESLEKELSDETAKIRDREQQNKDKAFKNRFPYGPCDYDSNPKKLDSILQTSILDMENSSKEFNRLCKTLFPEIYEDISEESNTLHDVFGTMADYPYIDPRSQGMLSIGNLFKLFKEFYMGYEEKTSIDARGFFERFLNISSLDIDTKGINLDVPGFVSKIDDIYEFNPELWYNNEDDKGFFKKNIGNRKNAFSSGPVSDSYGAFFEAPVLCNITEAQNAFRETTFTQGNEVAIFQNGIYNSKSGNKYMLSNDSRVFCLLLQQQSEASLESKILDNYRISELATNSGSYNSLRVLYNVPIENFKSYTTGIRIGTNPKNNYAYYIEKNNNYFNNLNINTEQTGGKKKNVKGGTTGNLFDTNGIPNLLAKKIGKPFNPKIFEESLKKYQNERLRFDDEILKILLKKIQDETSLPLILDSTKKNYGTKDISFEELRYLFHWSSVYTTYKKLLSHFFKNIHACYLHYKTSLIEPFYKNKSFNKKNELVPLFYSMQNNIDNLLAEIKKIIAFLEKNLIVKGKNTTIKNLFAGFDILNQGESFKNMSGKTFFPNIIEDSFFKDFFLMALIPDHFKSFIQLFTLRFIIKFGGIPIVLSNDINYIKNIPVCFEYFLKYRIITNKNLKEHLIIFRKEIIEQQSPAEIRVIISEIDREIDRIFEDTRKSGITNLMDKYRKYIELMISFGMKLFISILNSLVRNLSKKGNGKMKNKVVPIDSPENSNLIGRFKQEIYYFMQKLRDRNLLPENLYLFIFGKLFNFIYRLDFIIKSPIAMTGESFKKFIESIGIKLDWKDNDIQQWASQNAKILTNPEFQKKQRFRWFGLKTETVTSNAAAKELSNIFYNPAIFNPIYWSDIESVFLRENDNKKLLIFAVEQGKLGKNVYLIDPFSVAQSFETKPIIQNSIKTIEIVDENGVVQKEYYGSNQIIQLESFYKRISHIKQSFREWFSKTNYAKGLRKSEKGRAFAEFFKIRTNKKDRDFRQTDLMKRLLTDELDRYVDRKNNSKANKLKISMLMGYDRNQLNTIVKKNVFGLKDGNRFANNTTPYDDYQLYLISSDDLSSINRFRLWLWKLLMSKPLYFNQEYLNPGKIPLSDFSQIQVPFGKLFIKTGDYGLSSFLLEYFKVITESMKKKYNNNKNKNTASKLTKFIPMTSITQLELPKTNVLPELKIEESNTFNEIKSKNFSSNSGSGFGTPPNLFGAPGFGSGSGFGSGTPPNLFGAPGSGFGSRLSPQSPPTIPPSLNTSVSSVTSNNKYLDNIVPAGFSDWIRFVKKSNNPHLIKNVFPVKNWTILLQFIKSSIPFITIYYDTKSNNYYIFDVEANEGNPSSEIKKQSNKGTFFYYADCKRSGITKPGAPKYFIFNIGDTNRPITIESGNSQILYYLEYYPSTGYNFKQNVAVI